MSLAFERAIFVKTSPEIGVTFSKYLPSTGGTHRPPMKLSYVGCTVTGLPAEPGTS